MPVLSEDSIQCIEEALEEYSRRGKGIAEFLANVTSEKIVDAKVIQGGNTRI